MLTMAHARGGDVDRGDKSLATRNAAAAASVAVADEDTSKGRSSLAEAADEPLRRPFIKWAGGKTRLLRHLLPHVPPSFRNFHEPFLGGGAMFFAVGRRATGSVYLSDLSEELVNAWQVVAELGGELVVHLKPFLEQDSEDFYYSLRPHTPEDRVERACRFLYLNQTSWNGLWRVNKWGEFNVPWGQRPFRGFSLDDLDAIATALAGVCVEVEEFRVALQRVGPGDFVYLDPPYLPLSETSKFFLYTEKRFREPDLRELAQRCAELTDVGATWLLSNRDTPLVRELFADARIVALTTRRSVSAQNRRDVEAVDSPEVIVIGGAE
jgi:DNA adenine methylase